jgi:hypothetical protein
MNDGRVYVIDAVTQVAERCYRMLIGSRQVPSPVQRLIGRDPHFENVDLFSRGDPGLTAVVVLAIKKSFAAACAVSRQLSPHALLQ